METLPIMPDNIKSTLVLSEDEVVELFSYLLTTARVQIDDPDYYGPMRLLSAAEKLRDFVLVSLSDSFVISVCVIIQRSHGMEIKRKKKESKKAKRRENPADFSD